MSAIAANNIHGKMITIIAVGELRQVSKMDRKEAIERIQEVMTIIRTQHMCKDMDGECTTEDRETYIQRFEALRMAIEALQEKEQIIKQLEELRDEPLMYCSEDYWEGHYMAAKEAIAIVRGEEE